MHITTGYFGKPAPEGSLAQAHITLVHFVRDGKPICGSVVKSDLRYLQCAPFMYFKIVSCEKCKKVGVKTLSVLSDVGKKPRTPKMTTAAMLNGVHEHADMPGEV